ncbi:MAG: acetoin utilization protein AcuC [Candidatus Lokiarchaeota archaeon]|nr:acetoin utilization protein AcuC [Candidatus Lokiarchaeota archaeon]
MTLKNKCDISFIYTDKFMDYDFGSHHPLDPIRLKFTYELMKSYNLLDLQNIKVIEPRIADQEELELVHERPYINIVKKVSNPEVNIRSVPEVNLGPGDNPIFPRMYEASSLVAGASITAAKEVLEGKSDHAFNISGGLHHAMPDHASGFCIFNDPAITIKYIREKYDYKVCYIDIDAHHGDGVQWIFYDNPNVLTFSSHQYGFFYPGTGDSNEIGEKDGRGYAINLPLMRGSFNDEDTHTYNWAFNEIIPPLLKVFNPDIIVMQCGVDTHYTDPLPSLLFTTKTYAQIITIVHELAHEFCDGRWIALGGGGYSPFVVARSWTIFLAEMAGIKLDNTIPQEWIDKCNEMRTKYGAPKSNTLYDEYNPTKNLSDAQRKEIIENYEKKVKYIKDNVFPIHNIE